MGFTLPESNGQAAGRAGGARSCRPPGSSAGPQAGGAAVGNIQRGSAAGLREEKHQVEIRPLAENMHLRIADTCE